MVMKVDSDPLYLANVDVKSRQITSKKSSNLEKFRDRGDNRGNDKWQNSAGECK